MSSTRVGGANSTAAPATSTVVSADGTRLTTQAVGTGPLLVLVDPAMATRRDSAKLTTALAPHFTVVGYDRRGRGDSGDADPTGTDVANEVADVAAVIAAHGGRAILFGSSSGAALALEAAARLGDAVTGLVIYEPPFIVDDSRAPVPHDLPRRIAADVADGRTGAASAAFFTEAVGVPPVFVAMMRLMPMWRRAKRIVPTVRYDFAVLEGLQDGRPLPADRWKELTAPGVVIVGSRSEPFFRAGARSLAEVAPSIEFEVLEGGHHGTPMMSPAPLAQRMIARFASS
ncbi:pimeloyl-ACP methyl ester carboxylesterase [Agromyces sp. 3263]|uniref:alpha/beta fold hydrolase n=1 Tax=Agromyces sp. 3263 TaxID=2817750 RepID=UPI0028657033|nr:alpha/beta hydrolase [Agromyces sp. 3263]MDR6907170.1 pimeloyl-ACP methyl ester carboxylesterase [Agromyces sp. 3263]